MALTWKRQLLPKEVSGIRLCGDMLVYNKRFRSPQRCDESKVHGEGSRDVLPSRRVQRDWRWTRCAVVPALFASGATWQWPTLHCPLPSSPPLLPSPPCQVSFLNRTSYVGPTSTPLSPPQDGSMPVHCFFSTAPLRTDTSSCPHTLRIGRAALLGLRFNYRRRFLLTDSVLQNSDAEKCEFFFITVVLGKPATSVPSKCVTMHWNIPLDCCPWLNPTKEIFRKNFCLWIEKSFSF